jgi:hypothetical protein
LQQDIVIALSIGANLFVDNAINLINVISALKVGDELALHLGNLKLGTQPIVGDAARPYVDLIPTSF